MSHPEDCDECGAQGHDDMDTDHEEWCPENYYAGEDDEQ